MNKMSAIRGHFATFAGSDDPEHLQGRDCPPQTHSTHLLPVPLRGRRGGQANPSAGFSKGNTEVPSTQV